MLTRLIIVATAIPLTIGSAPGAAEPLRIPFDFSRNAIGLNVTIGATPAYFILDTGVDPSAIDEAKAISLGLAIERTSGGEASGAGNATHAKVFPTRIVSLRVGGRLFAPVEALTLDMAGLSARYGRKLDGVLGYSFLKNRIVLIDYPNRQLEIFDNAGQARRIVGRCGTRWSTAMRFYSDDTIPVLTNFRLGSAVGPASLDTGSNSGIALFPEALDLPGMRAKMRDKDVVTYSGARGQGSAKRYSFNAPVGFGPFTLPAGQTLTVREDKHSGDPRVANVGNALLSSMKLKMLLNYRAKTISFYSHC